MPKYIKPVYVRREGGSLVLVLGGVREMELYGIEEGDTYTLEVEDKDSNGKARNIKLTYLGKVNKK